MCCRPNKSEVCAQDVGLRQLQPSPVHARLQVCWLVNAISNSSYQHMFVESAESQLGPYSIAFLLLYSQT